MHKFNGIRQVVPMCRHRRTHFRHLAAAMHLMSNYFHQRSCYLSHTHLHSCADSQGLRAKYCIVGIPHNTAMYTVSEKVPTVKLSVTLSNLNRFSKFLHCWKACKICYKAHDITHLTLGVSLHYLGKLKIQIFCRCENCIFNHL